MLSQILASKEESNENPLAQKKKELEAQYGYDLDEEQQANLLKMFYEYLQESKARDMQKMKKVA